MIGADAVVHGIVLGLVYGVLAAGLVLVYRVSGVVNFAHGETGALGAAVLAKLVLDEHWPWSVALPLVLVLGGAVGALTEVLIGRRLTGRPKLVLLVATIGLSQLLLVGQLLIPSIKEVAPFPTPLHRQLQLGSVILRGPDFVAIAAIPALIVGLALWLGRTPPGRALRASGDNREAAELAGVRTKRVSLAAWTIAGVVSTATAVLANPLQGVIVGQPTESLGAGLLVRALVAALVGRLESIPLALVGGIGVGLVQAAADAGSINPAVVDLVLLVAVLLVVLLRRPVEGRLAGPSDGELARVSPPGRPNRTLLLLVSAAAAVAVLAPLVAGSSSQVFLLSRMALYAVVGLSLVIVTGWAGQLSLGQFALVGVGTFGAAVLEQHGVPFAFTIPLAAVAGAAVSLVIGLPALRVRGLELAVTTLAFAVACSSWLFTRSALLGPGGVATVTRAGLVQDPKRYYELCLVALGVGLALVSWLRRIGLGRSLLAVRSNERRAATLGVSPVVVKLAAFALAGAMAAAAGALLGGLRVHSSPADFGPDESLRIVAITVIGGAGSAVGAVLGAVVVLGVPAVFGSTTVAGLLPSGLGLLVLAVTFPGGLADAGGRILRLVGVAGTLPPPISPPHEPSAVPSARPVRPPAVLAVSSLTVRFGGRVALDGVDLDVAAGRIVGLIGSNGAGKSTLLDVISGFVVPDAGTIRVDGRDMTAVSATVRARSGIGRVMQDARLFDDLTLGEAVSLPAGATEATDAIALLGLEPWAATPCQQLPTGVRRLAELACAIVQRPSLLLLDEPTAGLAQNEADAFRPLLRAIAGDLGATVVLVEHDVSLVTDVADELVCLGAGKVLAAGRAEDVLADPAVVESFLGVE